jgi:large subunit ribosomal protein L35
MVLEPAPDRSGPYGQLKANRGENGFSGRRFLSVRPGLSRRPTQAGGLEEAAPLQEIPMPKMKSNKSAAKRFGATALGKVKRNRAFARHNLTSKTTQKKRLLRTPTTLSRTSLKSVRKLLPYLGV